MKKILLKILKIFGVFLSLLFFIWLCLYINSKINIPEGNTVSYPKGVWLPVPTDAFLSVYFDTEQLKEDGINTISLGPLAMNRIVSVITKPFYASLVKKAHKEGFAVHIAPLSWGPGFDTTSGDTTLENLLTSEAIYWAEFSEQYNIEYFSPQNEHDVVLGPELGAEWAQEVLPLVRAEYNGEIILKMGHINAPDGEIGEYTIFMESFVIPEEGVVDYWEITFSDATGYDYIMIDFFPPDELTDNQLFMNDLESILIAAQEEADKKSLKGVMVGEFGYPLKKPKISESIMPGVIVTEEEQAEMIGEYLDTAMPLVDGIIHCGYRMEGYGFANQPAEEIIKQKFTVDY